MVTARPKTLDDFGILTETATMCGGLERQRQRVFRAHPSASFTDTGHVLSKFDESGRRYQRTNPGDITATTWHFDQKHRPIETYLNRFDSSGDQLISEYAYLGGGLMHSRQTKYMKQNVSGHGAAIFPIVSNFTRDDLLRVTSVRHHREDGAIGMTTRLLGRYDYAYDANSMMRYEARWHESDNNGASTTPDEIDFYWYDKANRLEKAVYNVTGDALGNPVDLAGGPAFDSFVSNLDSLNNAIFSDRVHYSRRRSGTRDSVNWNRGSATRTGPPVAPQDDSVAGPTQRTGYDTSDDPNADDGNPAADGGGSRHNYTVIGQVGLTHDHNRNVLADGTREFRYNYKNQLRRVWRKSDGETDGAISKYREDAFGRRVYAETSWELSRRVYLDTRFELDIDMDADNDSQSMVYVDGGITSTHAAAPGQTDQKASWDSRIDRPHGTNNESHYFDFLVDVPDTAESGETYLGFVAYDRFELQIFSWGYELWDMAGTPTLIDSVSATTAGRRNIGIRAGLDAGVWVDGTRILGGPTTILPRPLVRFGTHWIGPADDAPGLVLLENLCYVRSRVRALSENAIPDQGVPVVSIYSFDEEEPITTRTPFYNGSSVEVVLAVNTLDCGISDINEAGEISSEVYLVNGRGLTGQVIRVSTDMVSYEGGSGPIPIEYRVPGVAIGIHVDAAGAGTPFANRKADPTDVPYPANEWAQFGVATASFDFTAAFNVQGICVARPNVARGNPSEPMASVSVAIETAMVTDGNGGDQVELPQDVPTRKDEGLRRMIDSLNDWLDNHGDGYTAGTGAETRALVRAKLMDQIEWLARYAKMKSEYDQKNWWALMMRLYDAYHAWKSTEEATPQRSQSNVDKRTMTKEDWLKTVKAEIEEASDGLLGNYEAPAEKVMKWVGRKVAERAQSTLKRIVNPIGSTVEDLHNTATSILRHSQEVDRNGDEVGLIGGIGIFVMDDILGVREMGDGAEMIQEGKYVDGATKFIDGAEKYAGAVTAVGGGLIARAAKGMCFVAGTKVVVLADGAEPEAAVRALERGADGTDLCVLKNVEDVSVGDWVLSRPENDPRAPLTFQQVTHTFRTFTDGVVGITTITGHAGTRTASTVWATCGHPFWISATSGGSAPLADPASPHMAREMTYQRDADGTVRTGDQGWVFAADLQPGYTLQTAGGAPSLVVGTRHVAKEATPVYNFRVAGTHTYFVVGTTRGASIDDAVWVHNTNAMGRNGAFRKARSDAGIPKNANPIEIRRVELTRRDGSKILGRNGKPVVTREYVFQTPDGRLVIIQDHGAGHPFHVDPHMHVRPANDPRNGNVPGTQGHYDFSRTPSSS